jgi:hypothetical protein
VRLGWQSHRATNLAVLKSKPNMWRRQTNRCSAANISDLGRKMAIPIPNTIWKTPPSEVLGGVGSLFGCSGLYSRLPKKDSRNMNMLIKSRYKRNAPMIADLPNHSLSPCWACAIYSLLMDWVS